MRCLKSWPGWGISIRGSEQWPNGHKPENVAYFCGALLTHIPAEYPNADGYVKTEAIKWLSSHVRNLWPDAVIIGAFGKGS